VVSPTHLLLLLHDHLLLVHHHHVLLLHEHLLLLGVTRRKLAPRQLTPATARDSSSSCWVGHTAQHAHATRKGTTSSCLCRR
jgi:hypothetical protein